MNSWLNGKKNKRASHITLVPNDVWAHAGYFGTRICRVEFLREASHQRISDFVRCPDCRHEPRFNMKPASRCLTCCNA